MEKVNIEIDGQRLLVDKDISILKAALDNRMYIPHLCYHPDLKPAGSCRLCLVELDDGHVVTSCRTMVREGMHIKTNTDLIDKTRRPIVEMIIANHHMDCKNCLKKGQCQLQRIMAFMKIDKNRVRRLRLPNKETPIDDSNPFFYRDHNKCVLCGICVRTCHEIVGMSSIDFAGRGINTKIATFGDKPILESNCISCGECVVRCPVGALIIKDFRRPLTESKTVCPHCGLGCGLLIGTRDNQIVNVKGNFEHSVNKGLLCVRGRFCISFVSSEDRFYTPLIRKKKLKYQKTESKSEINTIKTIFEEASWDSAIDLIAKKLKKIKGSEFAMIASPRCTNEDNYIAQKFARVVMKSNNIDSIIRLSDLPSINAIIQTGVIERLGNLKDDLSESKCILIVGSDITKSHPVISMKIKNAVSKSTRLITISVKETDLTLISDVWLKVYPGTESAVIMGMCNFIVNNNLQEEGFIEEMCENYEEFRESLENFTGGRVERLTGVSRELLEEAAEIFARNYPAMIFWSPDITKYTNATLNVSSIINLSLLNSKNRLIPLWEKNNSLGLCISGCLPDYYPSFQPIKDSLVNEHLGRIWNTNLDVEPGLTLYEILEKAKEGKIKVLYIIGSDLIFKVIPYKLVRDALKKVKFIIIQDIFINDTSQFAHVILPVTTFLEKDGTFTSIGNREQRIEKVLNTKEGLLPDWRIICDIAKRLGVKGFDYNSVEEIHSELLAISKTKHQNHRYRFSPIEFKATSEVPNMDFPLILTKGFNYMNDSISQHLEGLRILSGRELVYINPKDASDFNIEDGQEVAVTSRWGKINTLIELSDKIPIGLLIANLADKKINQLFNPVVDPISKTPETAICAVRIDPLKKRRKYL